MPQKLGTYSTLGWLGFRLKYDAIPKDGRLFAQTEASGGGEGKGTGKKRKLLKSSFSDPQLLKAPPAMIVC